MAITAPIRLNARPGGTQARPFLVVAFVCDADLRLCQAVVRALAETRPDVIYRINPQPIPPRAFTIRLVLDPAGAGHLAWAGGHGPTILQKEHKHDEFARLLVRAAAPVLPQNF